MDNNEVVTAPETEAVETPAAAETPAAQPQQQQRPLRPMKKRKKVCIFCADKIDYIDYKDTVRLKKLVSERSKILPRRISGTCAVHQRQLTVAVKRARQMALIPYVSD